MLKWIKAIFSKSEKWKITDVNDTPAKIRSHTIYRVNNAGVCWQALMRCPCGCKTVLHLNTLPEYKPSWRITVNNKKCEISIHPSIHRKKGCCSHFFLTNSKVIWV